jgi:NAD(P)-dependent dehydrogenase (short-subunit alcohol dehydrogenase family)
MLRGMRCLSNGPIVRFRYFGISVDARASLLEMVRVWQHLADEQGRATNVQQQQAAIAVKGDVAKAADMQRLFDETKKAFGTIDVLVNNAGVYKFVPLEDITEDEFHREFNINVLGTILATKEAVKHFGPNGVHSNSARQASSD